MTSEHLLTSDKAKMQQELGEPATKETATVTKEVPPFTKKIAPSIKEAALARNNVTLFQSGQKVDLLTVLERREQRVKVYAFHFQKKPNDTIIALKLNLPGPIKNNALIQQCFIKLLRAFWTLVAEHELDYQTLESKLTLLSGPEIIIASHKEAAIWKDLALQAENISKSARLLDIDVITQKGTITRAMYNLPERKCFLCANDAKVCARSRQHSVLEMQTYINQMCLNDGLY